jgi:RHS repeat-associated protein
VALKLIKIMTSLRYKDTIPGDIKLHDWNEAMDGDYANTYSFDADDNITHQDRSVRLGGGGSALVDNMDYQYEDLENQNRLMAVKDNADPSAGPYRYEAGNEGMFIYDASGRMIEDQKEYLTVDWYAFDKPKSVTKALTGGGSATTEYLYDALHNRVVKSTENNGVLNKTVYIRDANGNIMAVYEYADNQWRWTEQHLYGAERLGVHYTGEDWDAAMADEDLTPDPGVVGVTASGLFYLPSTNTFMVGQSNFKGRKNYELTNHLGNVMAVVSDKLTKYSVVEAGVIPYSLPNMVSATDYDPFGMALEERQWQLSGVEEYSFSFNGKIEDAEILDRGRWQDYGFRAYRPDLGRFVSVDPLKGKYPQASTYAFVLNNPVIFIDPDGRRVEFANSESEKAYTELKEAYKSVSSARYDDLIRLENADNVVFTINVNADASTMNTDGTVRLNQEKEGVVYIDVLVRSNIEEPDPSRVGDGVKDKRVVLSDELEGSRQFLDFEIGFRLDEVGKSTPIGYDYHDEVKTQDATLDASAALGVELHIGQQTYKEVPRGWMLLNYPELKPHGLKLAGDGGNSVEKLQENIEKGHSTLIVFNKPTKDGPKLTTLKSKAE